MTDDELAMYDSLACLDDEQWMDTKRELLAEIRRLRAELTEALTDASCAISMLEDTRVPMPWNTPCPTPEQWAELKRKWDSGDWT